MANFETSKSFELISSWPTSRFSIDIHYKSGKYNVKISNDYHTEYSNENIDAIQNAIYWTLARIEYHYTLSSFAKIVLIYQIHLAFQDVLSEADKEWNKSFIPISNGKMIYGYQGEDLNLIFLEYCGKDHNNDIRVKETIDTLEEFYGKPFAEKLYVEK